MGHPEAAPASAADRGIRLDLWQLEPTWPNIEMLLHRVWGRLKDLDYESDAKNEIGALQALLTRKRDDERQAHDELRLTLRRLAG